MSHDAKTFNVCDNVMSGWQDSFVLKLALQPVGEQSLIGRRSVADRSPISHLAVPAIVIVLVAERSRRGRRAVAIPVGPGLEFACAKTGVFITRLALVEFEQTMITHLFNINYDYNVILVKKNKCIHNLIML